MNRADTPGGWRVRWLMIAAEASLVVVAFVAGYILDQPPLTTLYIAPTAAVYGLLATVPLAMAVAIAVHWRPRPLQSLFQLVENQIVPLFRRWSLAELALVSALAGIGEEMLFRGVLQGWVAGSLGDVWGVVVASVVFGMVHPISRTYVILVTLVGAYLGALWIATDNLLVPIVVHGLYDFFALVYLLAIDRRRQAFAAMSQETRAPDSTGIDLKD